MAKKKEETEIELPGFVKHEADIPDQQEFYKIPARFGAVPVDEAPLGWEVETRRRETKITKFEHAFPKIYLPFQEVQRVEFGHNEKFEKTELFPTGANRLFFGDNLHIMRQLPSNSIDLIYIDPPFFSGKTFNVIFGDNNEVRSFSDIWEDGMPGFLIWLNVRLFEMKRLLKNTGCIYVHLDWHASHYVKVEMDKIFGYDNFLNEIVWSYETYQGNVKKYFARKHDILLLYKKGDKYTFHQQHLDDHEESINYERWKNFIVDGNKIMGDNYPKTDSRFMQRFDKWVRVNKRQPNADDVIFEIKSFAVSTCWKDIKPVDPKDKSERIGYPTQKPQALLQRVIESSTNEGDVVADFFGGGGTTATVAQKLNRRWITSDQSRIAVSLISDRVSKVVESSLFPTPDLTVEHCGIYEAPKLELLEENKFREFIIKAYGGKSESVSKNIHGIRNGVPLYVGNASKKVAI